MIKCKNLSVKFDNKEIIKDFNNTFFDDSITCIMGESGKGKTTLLRCIAGLLKPQSGQIIYTHDDKKEIITEPNPNIFMMHQHYTNFPWKTCLDNILFPLEINGKIKEENIIEAKELLKRLNLVGCENKYPSELSGGMNQRLSLARTLIAKPKVILMDEPMSALDPETRKITQNLLLEYHKKMKNIIILITHDKQEAMKMGNYIINF